MPPLVPVHVQLQGPVPITAVAVPVVQRLAGVVDRVFVLSVPQAPLTGIGVSVADSDILASTVLPAVAVTMTLFCW